MKERERPEEQPEPHVEVVEVDEFGYRLHRFVEREPQLPPDPDSPEGQAQIQAGRENPLLRYRPVAEESLGVYGEETDTPCEAFKVAPNYQLGEGEQFLDEGPQSDLFLGIEADPSYPVGDLRGLGDAGGPPAVDILNPEHRLGQSAEGQQLPRAATDHAYDAWNNRSDEGSDADERSPQMSPPDADALVDRLVEEWTPRMVAMAEKTPEERAVIRDQARLWREGRAALGLRLEQLAALVGLSAFDLAFLEDGFPPPEGIPQDVVAKLDAVTARGPLDG